MYIFKFLFLLFCFFHMSNLAAQTPRTLHNKYQFIDAVSPEHQYLKLVIKFHDDLPVVSDKGIFLINDSSHQSNSESISRELYSDIRSINDLLKQNNLSTSPLFDEDPQVLSEWVRNAEEYWGHTLANLNSYHQVMLNQVDLNAQQLELLLRDVLEISIVETAYPETVALPLLNVIEGIPKPYSCQNEPLDINVGDITGYQGYRYRPPEGINAAEANSWLGGKGEEIRIIDIEGGYWHHRDHKKPIYVTGHPGYQDHGTMVVGVINAKDNDVGITGIAPKADIGVRGIYNKNLHEDWIEANIDSANVASNIYWGAKHSLKGLVLIELQRPALKENDHPCSNYSSGALPVEFWPAEFDVIKAAVGNGVVVVEAAGNGSRNLGHPILNVCNGGCFDKNVRDSGAIIVAGSESDGLTPMCGFGPKSNYGERVDVHSWGENVATTSVLKKDIYKSELLCNNYGYFSGSSSASAIIAGATAILQGVSKAYTSNVKDPLYIRQLLSKTGVPQNLLDIDGGVLIGTHPDLVSAIKLMLE